MRSRIPHPLVLLVVCVFAAAVLTHLVRAGEFERRDDPATGRRAVVAGSFHLVPQTPVGPFAALMAVPQGMTEAAAVIFLVFLVGGAFSVVENTGAFNQGVIWLVKVLRHRTDLIVPICCVTFAAGGAVEGMWEEVIPMVPVLLLLVRSAGYDPITAVAMSIGSAAVGIAFSPINPFSVGIAQKVAQLPLLSGVEFRMAVLTAGLAIWTWWTMRHAKRMRTTSEAASPETAAPLDWRRAVILLMVGATFVVYVIGALRYDWGFDELGALFFGMGVLAGLLAGLGIDGTARAFVEGFRSMAFAATLIGFARAIFVVLDKGKIVDTVINGDAAHGPAGGRVRARDDGGAGRDFHCHPEHLRPRGADHADSRADVGSPGRLEAGDRARVSVRRRRHQPHPPDGWHADGRPCPGGGPLRSLVSFRGARVRGAVRAGSGGDYSGRDDRAALAATMRPHVNAMSPDFGGVNSITTCSFQR
jgi:C4-dicarboxylate anaerobic transporter